MTHARAITAILLAVLVLGVFWPVSGHAFLFYDDDRYVTRNPRVQAGLTVDGLAWAVTAFHAANWHPVTWISHMLDQELFGGDPAGHHRTSLLLHVANTLLLFLLLARLTGGTVPSAVVAALFGIHPLHVESVAWVAERKDVLSTLLWLLMLLAYAGYARRRSVARYLTVVLLFALGLGAKPMLVTAPLVLLLLDFWPLGRLRPHAGAAGDTSGDGERRMSIGRLIVEKIPLLVLSAASCIVTVIAQRSAGAIATAADVALPYRIGNAVVSYATYLWKTVWPARLAVHYPHPRDDLAWWKAAVALLVVGAITALAWRLRQRRPYLLFGWAWYVVTLVPVIGLVQVGSQAMADRYTYVPLIGVFVMTAWGLSEALGRGEHATSAIVVVWVVVVAALAVVARVQVGHWRDTVSLFEHTLAVAGPSAKTHNVLGLALMNEGRLEEAIEQYRLALEINPRYAEALNNLGGALDRSGRRDEAIERYEQALAIAPGYPEANNNLGVALAAAGRIDEAIERFEAAVAARPGYGMAHANLAAAFFNTGDDARAWREIGQARAAGHEPPAGLVRRLTERTPPPKGR